MPNSRHTSVIVSPSNSRATNRRRSSITELAFHGIHTSRRTKAESVTHVSGTKCHLCLGPLNGARYHALPAAAPASRMIPASCGSPRREPRYPARDGGAERLVLSPKRLLERGLFVRHDDDVEEEPEQRAVDDEAPIAHQHRLTQDDGNDRDVYWITDITVETGHHEIPGRRDGRGGAETLQRETRKCVNDPRNACENHYRAEAARQLQTKA